MKLFSIVFETLLRLGLVFLTLHCGGGCCDVDDGEKKHKKVFLSSLLILAYSPWETEMEKVSIDARA